MMNKGIRLAKLLAVLGFVICQIPQLIAQHTGPACAERIYNNNEQIDAKRWFDAGLAKCDDDASYATTDLLNNGQISSYIMFENFGLDVPYDATIEGIEVVVIRRSHQAARLSDRSVRLIRNGRLVGADLRSSEPWDDSWTAVYYGGENNIWGGSWAPALINSDHFGVALSVEQLGGTSRAEIDEVLVTVYYSEQGDVYKTTNIRKRSCLPAPF